MSNPVFLFATAGALLLALGFIALPLLRGGQKATLIGTVVLVPAATLALYSWIGTPAGIDPDTGETGEIRSSVADLARRALREPDKAENWARLGLAYKSLEEFSSAEHALRRALYIDADAGFIKAELGETLLYASGERQLPDEARALLRDAADDGSQKAMWLLGLEAFQQERFDEATRQFETLLSIVPADSNVRPTVEEYLTRSRSGGAEAGARSDSVPGDRETGDTAPSLQLRLSIDDRLAGRLEGDETVFLAVRRASGGPPLAVRRLRADELPLELTIDDDDAMMAGNGLSAAEAVVVVARVSFSGDATAATGDFEGRTDILSLDEEDISAEVTIDQVL